MAENPILPFFMALAIIILAARVFGSLARAIGQPRVLGELIAGVVLGPTLLNVPHWSLFGHAHIVEMVKPFAELGVLFLMFLIGLEVQVDELLKVGRVALFAGFLGALIPVAMTVPVGLAFQYSVDVALFAGVALAATSVSISAQVLLEIGHLHSKEGNALLATAIVDDVLAILLVSITLALASNAGTDYQTHEASSILIIVGRMVAYIGIALLLSWFVLPRIMRWIATHPRLSQSYGVAGVAIMFMLIFAWAAEYLGGVATITGAFIAGLGLTRLVDKHKHAIEETVSHIAYSLLMPIFFVSVGLETDLSAFPLSALPLATALLAVAVISKVGGSGLGARLGGFNNQEAFRVGVCMISRGEVGLIIAALGLSSGILTQDDPLFSSLFLVILLTTIVTPIWVRQLFPDQQTMKGQI